MCSFIHRKEQRHIKPIIPNATSAVIIGLLLRTDRDLHYKEPIYCIKLPFYAAIKGFSFHGSIIHPPVHY